VFHRYWKKTKKPIIITESGICTHDPKVRIESIKEYLGWVHKALEDGIPILGYFHWSTMDNHEWNIGQYYRFGLVAVDFETGKRTMTEAGTFLGEVSKNNSVEV
jgi:beta-glucosidase